MTQKFLPAIIRLDYVVCEQISKINQKILGKWHSILD
jgi:hypothetical protein